MVLVEPDHESVNPTALQHHPDRYLSESDVLLAHEGIQRIQSELGGNMPSILDVLPYRPPHALYPNPLDAVDRSNPHNEGHNGSVVSLGIPFLRLRALHWPEIYMRDRYMGIVFQLHDVRQGRLVANPFHGPEIAALFKSDSSLHGELTPIERRVVEYMLFYHSDRKDPPITPMRRLCLGMLHTLQDVDASFLTRDTLTNPIGRDQVVFRTPEARAYHLLEIARVLEYQSARTYADNLFEAHVFAACTLGLLVS